MSQAHRPRSVEEQSLPVESTDAPLTPAEQQLVLDNRKFAYMMANRYARVVSADPDDLEQAALLGLTRVVRKFKPERGFKFTTCAFHWIRMEISKAIHQSYGGLSVSPARRLEFNQLRQTKADLEQEFGRRPTSAEMADRLEISLDQLHQLRVLRDRSFVDYLDAPILDRDASSLSRHEVLTSALAVGCGPADSDESILAEERRQVVRASLDRSDLTDLQRDLIERYIGLNGHSPANSLRQIADERSISHQAVQQTVSRGLIKLAQDQELASWNLD